MGILQNCDTRLEERLELHRLWLEHSPGGVRADLTGAVLSDLKLEKANLSGAILRRPRSWIVTYVERTYRAPI